MEKSDVSEPSGIGGWLIILMLNQIFAPVITIGVLWRSSLYYGRIWDMPGGKIAICGEVFLTALVFAIEITTLVLMCRQSRLFTHWFTSQCVVTAGSIVVSWLFVSWALNISIDRLVEPEEAQAARHFIIFSVIWIIYVHRSVRVRNTFTS